MRTELAVVDTGPVVALFRESDEHHDACKRQFGLLPRGLPTTWPVLTEAFFLLRGERQAVSKLIQLVEEGILVVRNLEPEFAAWLRGFATRFGDRELQLADASVVYLAEREGIHDLFTLDRRDFAVYRTSGGRSFRLLPE